MGTGNPLLILLYITPVIAAVLAISFLHLAKKWKPRTTDIKLRNLLTAYFAVVLFNWICVAMAITGSYAVIALNGLIYGGVLSVKVILYHFLYVLTADQNSKPFLKWHYLIPVLVCIILTVWIFLVPREVAYFSVYHKAMPGGDPLIDAAYIMDSEHYSTFVKFAQSKRMGRLLYNLVYVILSLLCVIKYRRKIVNFSAETDKASLGWIYYFLLLTLFQTFNPFVWVSSRFYNTLFTINGLFPVLFLFIQLPVLCYFTLTRKYVLMKENRATSENITEVYSSGLSTQSLESYMLQKKPYLKTNLKITDMTVPLKTNRSYLSSLINKTYGMNFSQFINTYRLRELQVLLDDPENSVYSTPDLISRAGFGSYHAYYRAKYQYDQRTLLSR